MKQITFIADGTTKVFDFTFSFFLKSDVIIEVDSRPATNYNLICKRNGLNADIPFSGGCVQFNKPPKMSSIITVRRNLPLTRIVDYQPTALYNPTALNQDFNYLIEVMKDMKDAIETVLSLPTDAANKDAIDVIKRQIVQITSSIDAINIRIEQMGAPDDAADISEINNNIEGLRTEINTLNTQYNELKNQIENMGTTTMPDGMDYVVEAQRPTAENNYTWYRKYKSGWVEQGGIVTGSSSITITFPLPMADNNYMHILNAGVVPQNTSVPTRKCISKTDTSMVVCSTYAFAGGTNYDNGSCVWMIFGLSA